MILTLAICIPLAVALAVTGVVAALQRRRLRQLTSASGVHQVLADAHASWVVDHALKALVEACLREPRLVPGVVMVVLRETTIAVHVSSPTAHPPAPWRTSADGCVWTTDIVAVQAAPLSFGTTHPYSGLVTLGVTNDGRVFVNLDEAHGLVSIGGESEARRVVAERWITEAASRPWSTGEAQLVGLDADARPLSAPASALDQLVTTVASGAAGLTFVDSLPGDATTDRLVHALETHGCLWPVVVVGAVSEARWRFTAHSNGWMTSDFLPSARWDADAIMPEPGTPDAVLSLAPSAPTGAKALV